MFDAEDLLSLILFSPLFPFSKWGIRECIYPDIEIVECVSLHPVWGKTCSDSQCWYFQHIQSYYLVFGILSFGIFFLPLIFNYMVDCLYPQVNPQ